MLPLRLRLHMDASMSEILEDFDFDQCGVWVLLDKKEVLSVAALWDYVGSTCHPELGNRGFRDFEMRSQDCRLPWSSSIEILQDGQEVTLYYCTNQHDGKKRRRQEEDNRARHNLTCGTPGSVPFTASPVLSLDSSNERWQSLRKRYRRKYVPDWAIAKLQPDVLASDKGIPQSGIEGVTWSASTSKVGWQARYKSARQFFSLAEFSHADALSLARRWIADLQRGPSATQTASTERGCTSIVAYEGEDSGSGCESDSLVIKSEVRGVGLCKGSWKARWRDSSGRQRMRTFGPHPEDREAAEKFISEVRADIKGRREATKNMTILARTRNEIKAQNELRSAWPQNNPLQCEKSSSPPCEPYNVRPAPRSVIRVKEEDSKLVLASLLHAA